MKNKLNIRYIVELVITLLLILFITVVLVRMFVHSRGRTVYAGNLTEAVKISESLAEVSSGVGDKAAFLDMIRSMDHVISVQEEGQDIVVEMSSPDPSDTKTSYQVRITWTEEETDHGRFIINDINVFCNGDSEAIFSLNAGNYEESK